MQSKYNLQISSLQDSQFLQNEYAQQSSSNSNTQDYIQMTNSQQNTLSKTPSGSSSSCQSQLIHFFEQPSQKSCLQMSSEKFNNATSASTVKFEDMNLQKNSGELFSQLQQQQTQYQQLQQQFNFQQQQQQYQYQQIQSQLQGYKNPSKNTQNENIAFQLFPNQNYNGVNSVVNFLNQNQQQQQSPLCNLGQIGNSLLQNQINQNLYNNQYYQQQLAIQQLYQSQEKLQCQFCQIKFTSEKLLEMHHKISYDCNKNQLTKKCSEKNFLNFFNSSKEEKEELQKVQENKTSLEKEEKCIICSEKFSVLEDLNSHILNAHIKKIQNKRINKNESKNTTTIISLQGKEENEQKQQFNLEVCSEPQSSTTILEVSKEQQQQQINKNLKSIIDQNNGNNVSSYSNTTINTQSKIKRAGYKLNKNILLQQKYDNITDNSNSDQQFQLSQQEQKKNQELDLYQGIEKITMQALCPKKTQVQNVKMQDIKSDSKLWKSKYQNFNKLFMLKILNLFTLSNLSPLENMSEELKEKVTNYAQKIKLTGKRVIQIHQTKHVNNSKKKQRILTKKVKIDYFQNSHYLLCFLQITKESLSKIIFHKKVVDLHEEIFGIDIMKIEKLMKKNEKLAFEQLREVNQIKEIFFSVLLNCQKQKTEGNETVEKYTQTLLEKIEQMNQGEIILRFSQ